MTTIVRLDKDKDAHGEFVRVTTRTDRIGITFRITSENRIAMNALFGKRILCFAYATNKDGNLQIISEAPFQIWRTKKDTQIGATD